MKTKLFVLGISLALTKPTYGLASSIEITYDNLKSLLESRSTILESYRLDIQGSKVREGFLSRSYFPSLEFQAGQESFKHGLDSQKTQPSYGLEAKINLYNGGRDALESQGRLLATEKKTYQYARLSAEELLAVRELYWEIVYSQERILLIESLVKINEQNTSAALKRIRNGVATESDKMEFEIKAVELKQELEIAKMKLKIQLGDLKLFLNFESNANIVFPKSLAHQHDFETNLNHTINDHEFLTKENQLQSEIAALKSESYRRDWWPKIDAVAGYSQHNEREKEFPEPERRTESYIGLKLTMNLSAGIESSKESSAQQLESRSFKEQANYQRRRAHVHMENEITELKLLHSQIHEAEENIARAEKYYKLTQSEYSRGVKNSPDVLSASERIFDAKNRRLEIVKDFNLKQAHILAKINK